MKKVHFATRVTVGLSTVEKTESRDILEKRALLQASINRHKVSIDRECFQKTDEERAELKIAKKNYKKLHMS